MEICCTTQGTQRGALWQSRRVRWGGTWEGGDMDIPMTDSCWCMIENQKILESKYPSIKKVKREPPKKNPSDISAKSHKNYIHEFIQSYVNNSHWSWSFVNSLQSHWFFN